MFKCLVTRNNWGKDDSRFFVSNVLKRPTQNLCRWLLKKSKILKVTAVCKFSGLVRSGPAEMEAVWRCLLSRGHQVLSTHSGSPWRVARGRRPPSKEAWTGSSQGHGRRRCWSCASFLRSIIYPAHERQCNPSAKSCTNNSGAICWWLFLSLIFFVSMAEALLPHL